MVRTVSREWLRRQAGLFTIQELADSLDVNHWHLRHEISQGRVFRPSTRIGSKRRCYYTAAEVEEIRRRFSENQT